jgi:glycosyltransferase involved in cell wall biosynthesis
MSADALYFNSEFHLKAFFEALPRMLKHFYDYNELATVDQLRERASVLWLGLSLRRFDAHRVEKQTDAPPLIVWNHRWEEDKNPVLFLRTLEQLAAQGHNFRVAILGENARHAAPEFEAVRRQLGERVAAFGYLEQFADYARLLWEADYVVSTAYQEFFGGAIAEAVYCGCVPLLPDRLNYPNLLPAAARNLCLYRGDDGLLPLMVQHLTGEITVSRPGLRAHVARFDWERMAPQYDRVLRRLVQSPPAPAGR